MAKKDEKKAPKADTKGKDKKSKKDDEKEAAPEFKYGVSDLAEALDIEPASVRVRLRNKGIEKAGKSYGWNSKAELNEVVEQLKAKPAAEEKSSKKDKKDDKPAKKDKKDKKKSKKDKDDE